MKREGWRSPKAWLTTVVLLAAIWFDTYAVTRETTTATVVTGFLIFMGIIGALTT